MDPVGPDARDDLAEAEAGEPVRVVVTSNDVWSSGDAVVSLVDFPRGVEARVVGRHLVVTAPRRFAGETVEVHYSLSDDSDLVDLATVSVKVKPLPTDPPVVPIPTGAVHDLRHGLENGHHGAPTVLLALGGGGVLLILLGGAFVLVRRRDGDHA